MRALWASPLRSSSTVKIAEPLAAIPALNVVIQGVVPGVKSLKDLIKESFASGVEEGVEALSQPVRKVGRGLAELHSSMASGGPTVTWEDQVTALEAAVKQLGVVLPGLIDVVQPLLAGLEACALEVPADALVPTHGSFRPAQILIDADDIAFVDFDGFRQSEPGLDLALFRTTLCDLSLRAITFDGARPLDLAEQHRCLSHLDELCATFLAGYEEVTRISPSRLALWDVVTNTHDVVDCWRKIKFEHLDRRMMFLHRVLGG
jgi:aminoglycoside phosphotransferase (APT) family kinase protein